MYLLTPPTVEPVTVAEAKAAARIDDSAFDALLPGLISAARAVAEVETGLLFMEQVWRTELADWPAATDVIRLYRPSAVAVTYWDGATFATLTNGTGFAWGVVGNGFAIAEPLTASFPTLADIAVGPRVRIDATVGVADADDVHECVKTFIKALVTGLVRDPEASADAAADTRMRRLLDPVRVY